MRMGTSLAEYKLERDACSDLESAMRDAKLDELDAVVVNAMAVDAESRAAVANAVTNKSKRVDAAAAGGGGGTVMMGMVSMMVKKK